MLKDIIEKSQRTFYCYIASVMCYLPLIANGMTNSMDGLWKPTMHQAGNLELASGRWAWLFLDKARGGYAADPLNSLLALLFIAVAGCVIADVFSIAGRSFYIYEMLLLVNTATCCFLSYRFMSPTFGLSTLLSSISSWLLIRGSERKERRQRIIFDAVAIGFLVVSLGLYQAHIGIFCVILILYMMKLMLDKDLSKTAKLFGTTAAVAVVSCIIYKLCWDVMLFLRHTSASSYRGADSLSVTSMILNIPNAILSSYSTTIQYFSGSNGNYVFNAIRIMIFVVILVALIFGGIKNLKSTPGQLAVYLLLLLCLPVGANFFFVLAPDAGYVMDQMTGSMAFAIAVSFCYLENNYKEIGAKAIPVLAAIILYGNIYAVGTDIDALAQGSTSSVAIMENVTSSLIKEDLYGTQYEYAFIGRISDSPLFHKNELWDRASEYARFGEFGLAAHVTLDCYHGLLDDMGLYLKCADLEEYEAVTESQKVREMPVYPAEGSITLDNDIVIVKVSDNWE